jgi:hypothetical protein
MKLTIWAAVAALALVAPAAPTSGPDVAISEADFPHVRAGYWEVKFTGNNGVTDTHHSCSSGAPPKLKVGPYANYCHFGFKRTFLGAIVGDATCEHGGVTGTTHITAQGDFNTSYSMDSTGSMTFPGHPPITFKSHTEGRWVGPCPAGVTPDSGDQS